MIQILYCFFFGHEIYSHYYGISIQQENGVMFEYRCSSCDKTFSKKDYVLFLQNKLFTLDKRGKE